MGKVTITKWRVGEMAKTDAFNLDEDKNSNKEDIIDMAKPLSDILKRQYNPHTKIIIDSEKVRIVEEIFGTSLN
ncbi:hypothetical protein I9Y31_001282 [Clostridium perfringens]|nr:hypothetical protein [Clostridium perfringens]